MWAMTQGIVQLVDHCKPDGVDGGGDGGGGGGDGGGGGGGDGGGGGGGDIIRKYSGHIV